MKASDLIRAALFGVGSAWRLSRGDGRTLQHYGDRYFTPLLDGQQVGAMIQRLAQAAGTPTDDPMNLDLRELEATIVQLRKSAEAPPGAKENR